MRDLEERETEGKGHEQRTSNRGSYVLHEVDVTIKQHSKSGRKGTKNWSKSRNNKQSKEVKRDKERNNKCSYVLQSRI